MIDLKINLQNLAEEKRAINQISHDISLNLYNVKDLLKDLDKQA